ncbi:MAG TPA: ATP-binding cassette domain-containing protein [Anaeromyxobacter sp.]
MIRVEGLEKRHPGAGEATLRSVSFHVPAGRLVAVVGSSGAGKSTLLRCLVGLEVLDAGTIEIDGVVARAVEGRRASALLRGRVGLVPQSLDLFPHLSALENCTLAPRVVKREAASSAEARASRLLGRLGLDGKLDAYPEQLSGGQRQRVAIARALAMEPRVLLYDEPTSSLDPSIKDEVRRALLTVAEGGVTQIVATHDIEFARSVARWVLVLEDGRIAREGEPATVLA